MQKIIQFLEKCINNAQNLQKRIQINILQAAVGNDSYVFYVFSPVCCFTCTLSICIYA